MVQIRSSNEDPIQIFDRLSFVSSQATAPGETHTPAYTVSGEDGYVIGVEANTPIAPELRDSNGDKLDDSTRVIFQKADPQGNPLGNAIVFEANLGQFDYEKFRSDPDYFVTTKKPLLLDERESLHIYLDIPTGSNGFDPATSRLTIGDAATQTGKPVYVRDKNSLSQNQRQAVDQASTGGGA